MSLKKCACLSPSSSTYTIAIGNTYTLMTDRMRHVDACRGTALIIMRYSTVRYWYRQRKKVHSHSHRHTLPLMVQMQSNIGLGEERKQLSCVFSALFLKRKIENHFIGNYIGKMTLSFSDAQRNKQSGSELSYNRALTWETTAGSTLDRRRSLLEGFHSGRKGLVLLIVSSPQDQYFERKQSYCQYINFPRIWQIHSYK